MQLQQSTTLHGSDYVRAFLGGILGVLDKPTPASTATPVLQHVAPERATGIDNPGSPPSGGFSLSNPLVIAGGVILIAGVAFVALKG